MSELAYVKLSEIHVWTDNPRTGTVDDEIEEIMGLIKEQQTKNGNKLVELAHSIVDKGIFEPIGVLKYKDGFMVVKEGNRRIACLKLLNNLNIIPPEYVVLQKAFNKLKTKANKSIFNRIPARIFDESENEDMELWIELRHNGLQGGKGLDSWKSMHIENWNKYRGKKTPLLDFHDYLISNGILTAEQIDGVSKTNWSRILGTVGREYLGLDYENSVYKIIIPKKEFKKRIAQTIEALSGKSVGLVYDNESIHDFFKGFNFNQIIGEAGESTSELDGSDMPEAEENIVRDNVRNAVDIESEIEDNNIQDTKDTHKKDNGHQSDTNEEAEVETVVAAGTNKKKRTLTKPKPLLGNITCALESDQDTDGIIRLVSELKKMSLSSSYQEYPIATAMLMRNLLEQCLIYYLKIRKKWRKLYSSKRNDPTLTEIIEKYTSDTDIFAQDKSLERKFIILKDTPGLKEYFNMIVHHPHQFAAKPELLDSIAQSGYLALIQHIIDYFETE
ncbi:ParB N-terminal domain-containing protein [Petroclostridium sp. X23]|uniref:ParB N-terminal domain-containing protein n=1 Tax=Petroclostridium sp. X23 TaxID=3045146 RepID=UPI0024ACB486|nr:ParB N-terminal domain-containing protein [Petroclostridium sp. X23]WHH58267.1 ParB N-terminal domain-containing protein [Petroclostridium sp. X23]